MTPAPERDRSGEQARGSGPRECLLSTHEREGEHTVTCPDARGSPFEERTRLAGNTLHVAAGDVTSGRNPPSLRRRRSGSPRRRADREPPRGRASISDSRAKEEPMSARALFAGTAGALLLAVASPAAAKVGIAVAHIRGPGLGGGGRASQLRPGRGCGSPGSMWSAVWMTRGPTRSLSSDSPLLSLVPGT